MEADEPEQRCDAHGGGVPLHTSIFPKFANIIGSVHKKIDCPQMCSHHSQTSVLLWPSNIHQQVVMPVMTEKVKMSLFDVLTQRVEMIASHSFFPFSFCYVALVNHLNNDRLGWTVIVLLSQIAALSSLAFSLSTPPIFCFLPNKRRKVLMNYECSESRADFVLLPRRVLIKKDTIKNASIRIGWVLIICYIIKQAVYCCVI